MATPMTPSQMLAAMRAEGVKVQQWPGWRDRCRCHNGSHEKGARPTGRPWGTMNGVMIHHTGSDSQADSYLRNVLASGYSGLPGPLCHAAGRMDGTVTLVGSGRANHAGGGDPAVLARVRAESYSGALKPSRGNSDGVDGNRHFYGIEAMYDGGQPMTAAQLDGAVRWAAAICRFHGWSAKSVIGHGEWSNDKWDPGKQSMPEFRRLVQARLDGNPKKTPTPTGDEFDMATLDELRKIVAQESLRGDHVPAPAYAPKDPRNPTWTGANVLSYTLDIARAAREHAVAAEKNSAATLAIVREMAKRPGPLTDDQIEAAAKRGLQSIITDVDVTVAAEGGDDA